MRFTIARHHMFGQSRPQMNRDFDHLAGRAAPAIFVVLWSTGFIATKYVLNSAEPLTYLTIRMAVVVAMMAVIVVAARPLWPDTGIFHSDERLDLVAVIGIIACAAAVFLVNWRPAASRIDREAKVSRHGSGSLIEKSAQRLDFFAFFFFLAAFLPAFLADFFADFFAAFLDFFAAFFFGAAFFFFAFLTAGLAAIFGGSAGGLIASGIGSLIGLTSSMSSPRVYRRNNDSGILGAVKATTTLAHLARSSA
jgi:hypothetical protein